MGILGDTWDGIKSGASEIGGWAEDVYDGAGNLVKRGGQAVGLVKPDDMIDEQGAMAGAGIAADEVLRKALEQQDLLNQGIQTGNDITKFASGYGGPATITPERIGGVLPQSQVMADWKQSNPIERITAAQTAPAQNVEMGPVNTTITGPGSMSAAQASSLQADRTAIDPLANALRGEQLDAARALATGPSVADAKFRAGLAATAEEQLGLVAGARGSERAGLRSEAVRQMAAKGVQGAALGAAASAQEELAKKQALATALSGMRGQDADVSTAQASLDAQRNNLNAQLATTTSQGNAQAVNALKTQQAQLEQAAKTNTAQLGLNAATATADVAGQNAARQSQIALANTGATNQFAATNAAAANAQNEANAARATQTSQFNASQGNTIGANNLQTALDIQKTNAASDLTAQQQNAANELATQQQRVTGATAGANAATSAGNAGTSALGVAGGAAGTKADIGRAIIGGQTAQQQSEADSSGRLVKTVATVGATMAGGPAAGAVVNQATGQSGTGDDVMPLSYNTYTPDPVDNNAGREAAQKQQIGTGGQPAQTQAQPSTNMGGGTPAQANTNQAAMDAERKNLYGAGSTSDERAKTDVRAISDKDLLDFGASLKAASGRYKPGIEDGGKELHAFHPSAQDLEKNPIGRMFVNEQPDGLKQIAYGPEAALIQSALIRQLKRKGVL